MVEHNLSLRQALASLLASALDGVVTHDDDGNVLAIQLTTRWIFGRAWGKETESQSWLRTALETGQMGTWSWDLATSKIVWMPGLAALHGLSESGASHALETVEHDVPRAGRESILAALIANLEQERECRLDYRLVWPDNSFYWIETRAKLFCNEAGQPLSIVGTCMDISARKESEEEIRRLNVSLEQRAGADGAAGGGQQGAGVVFVLRLA